MRDTPRHERDIKFQRPLDIKKVRANSIRTLETELPKVSERLESARKDLAQIQSSYTGDPKILERFAALVIGPLEQSVQDATKQLEELKALQKASGNSQEKLP